METPIRIRDSALPESCPSDMVDSMSSPHPAEYTSSHYALARDCAILKDIEQDMEACRIRIARTQAEMRLLERQRDAVQRRVSIHRARLSPLRTIPDQILQEIFQHCLPDTPYVLPDAYSAPLILTHVCRRWRIVVHASSELWSSIALRDLGVWNYELDVEMIKHWLGRSRMRPICISITCPPRTDFGPDLNVSGSDIFRLAMAHSAQLSDVYLNVNRTYLHHFLKCANLRELRSIVISLHSVHRIDEPLELNAPASISAPNLRSIAFKGDGTWVNLIPRSVLPQITHLSLDCHASLDLTLLFQDFSYLQHLSLVLSFSMDALGVRLQQVQRPHQAQIHRLVVPSLHTLHLHLDKDFLEFGDPATLDALLDQLELPALRTLTLVLATSRRPYIGVLMGHTEAQWDSKTHATWLNSAGIEGVLSRSRRHGAQARLVCQDRPCVQGI